MSKAISIDFETYYDSKQGLTLKSQGMMAYTRDPRFDAYMVSVCDGEHTWAGPRNRFNWDSLDGNVLLSHNAAFDQKVYRTLVERGQAPKLNIPEWHCTANLSTFLCSRRDLGRAAEYLFGVTLDKSTRGSADGKTWEDIVREGGGKEMLEYARRDALYCWKIWNQFGCQWPDIERKLSALTIKQCERGAQIDKAKLELYYSVACKMLVQAEGVLPWIDEGRKPTSTKAVAEWCSKVGIPEPPVKAHDGEEAYDDWAATFAPQHQWVKAYTDYRVIKKFIGALETIKSRLFADGIFAYDLLYFGAHTGRWAGSGGFNMQNMRKEPLYCDVDGWLITDPAKLKEIDATVAKTGNLPGFVAYGLDIRALFIARPGKKLVISDLSQIEPRVLAWLIGDQKMLDLMASGQSPYEAHARSTMGWTGGELKKEDKDLYALAKARVLGLGYGCGWKKFITVAYTMAGLDITKDDPKEIQAVNDDGQLCWNADGTPVMIDGYGTTSKRIVKEYREQNPLLTSKDDDNLGLWETLDRRFKNSAEQNPNDFSITLPSGRVMHYPDVRQERKAVEDPDNPGKYRFKRCVTAAVFNPRVNAVVRTSLYGGLLTENLVQATARDVFGEQLVAMEADDIAVLWNVHDEAVTEIDQSRSFKDVQEHMSKAPAWMPGLPVACEAAEVKCYKK